MNNKQCQWLGFLDDAWNSYKYIDVCACVESEETDGFLKNCAQGSQGRRSNFHFPAAASELSVNRAYSFFLFPIPTFSSRPFSSSRPFPFASRLADRKISRKPHEWSLSAIK